MDPGQAVEYTDPQRAEFKQAYTSRLRRRVVGIGLMFAAMTRLALTEDSDQLFGVSATVFGPIAFVVLVVCWGIFDTRNWRCPACDESLGRAFPRRCRYCGIELR